MASEALASCCSILFSVWQRLLSSHLQFPSNEPLSAQLVALFPVFVDPGYRDTATSRIGIVERSSANRDYESVSTYLNPVLLASSTYSKL